MTDENAQWAALGTGDARQQDLVTLHVEADRLARRLHSRPGMATVGIRLYDAVVRPLAKGLGLPVEVELETTAGAEATGPAGTVEEIVELARALTRTAAGAPLVLSAAASAWDLAVELSAADGQTAIFGPLADLVESAPPTIHVVPNGPHVLTGTVELEDHLGCALPARPVMTLCRCGRSGAKPSCDGVCFRDGFDDAKDPNRVPDRRDSYVGVQVEVLDNRAVCQHSSLCTDRIATVFRLGQEPFVSPSGGRMDEIVRAVRDCPSGALSYAIDGVEARGQVDYGGRRASTIVVTKDGPYRVTGGVRLVDDGGSAVTRNDGASTEHYALCRCGQAQNKPFCSGMHWHVGFTDPVGDPDATPSVFAWAGGMRAFARLTRLFYEKHIPADPILAPVFANMSADHPQRVAKWLAEVFGGPARYSEEYGGYPRMLAEHIGRRLTEEQRARWVELLLRSASDAGLPNDAEFRSAFGSYIEWGSRLAVENSQTDSRPPAQMPMPHWDWRTAAGPPTGRVSALAPDEDEEAPAVVLPAHDEPVRFEKHVRPLFRRQDRQSMLFAFDLWNLGDVKTHAGDILRRVTEGTMPCDGEWPAERVEVFRRWVETDMSG